MEKNRQVYRLKVGIQITTPNKQGKSEDKMGKDNFIDQGFLPILYVRFMSTGCIKKITMTVFIHLHI